MVVVMRPGPAALAWLAVADCAFRSLPGLLECNCASSVCKSFATCCSGLALVVVPVALAAVAVEVVPPCAWTSIAWTPEASCWNGLASPTVDVPDPEAVEVDPAVPEGGEGSAFQLPPTPG
jgi:hypothetical protein